MAPVAFLLILGILDFGRAAYDNNVVSNASREGTRAAVPVNEKGQWPSNVNNDVYNAVLKTLGGGVAIDTSAGKVLNAASLPGGTTSCSGTSLPTGTARIYMTPYNVIPATNQSVTVTVCYGFRPYVPLINAFFPSTFILGASSTFSLEY